MYDICIPTICNQSPEAVCKAWHSVIKGRSPKAARQVRVDKGPTGSGKFWIHSLKFDIAPENRPSQKETIIFQPSPFLGASCHVSFREDRKLSHTVDG